MVDLDEIAGAIVDRIEADQHVDEFKRTVQHEDGSTTTFRVDVTDVDATHFTVRGVRQNGGDHHELAAVRLARGDRKRLADWLGESP